MQIVDDGCLRPGERKVQAALFQIDALELDRVRIALPGDAVDLRAAGIAEPQHAGHLVVGLAHRVVAGGAQDAEFVVAGHFHQMGMTAGHHERQERRFEVRMFDQIGQNVALDMVHADERLVRSGADRLRESRTHQEGAGQAGSRGDADLVDVSQRNARVFQRLIEHERNVVQVMTRSDLRHDAAVHFMHFDLGGDDVAQHFPAVRQDSDGSLVAAALDPHCQMSSVFHIIRDAST